MTSQLSPIVPGVSYTPKGTNVTGPDGMPLYVVGGGATTTTALLVTYDIFGYHPCTLQVCDLLASRLSTLVVVPDFFRGAPYPMDPWPPTDGFVALMAWVGKVGTYDAVKPMMLDALAYIKTQGVTSKVGGVGLCWGAKPMFALNADGLIGPCASCHPSFLTTEDAEKTTAPQCVLPTKDDGLMEGIKAALEKKDFAAKNVWVRFDDMHHGFAGARGDWTKPEQVARVQEAITIMVDFFNANL